MRLNEFTQEDFDGLYAFMRPLWLDTYADVLPIPQIEVLLDKYFSPEAITAFRAQGYVIGKSTT